MASLTTTPVTKPFGDQFSTVTDPDIGSSSRISKEHRNIRQGKCAVYVIYVDNSASDATKYWLKLFDSESPDDIIPGTTAPSMILPIEDYAATGGAIAVRGFEVIICRDGWNVDTLSMFGSVEDGNDATTSPGPAGVSNTNVYLVTS
jgi:hypothetical protein